jgi:hypothetical protein
MKKTILMQVLLVLLAIGVGSGCKTNSLAKARARSEKLHPQMSIDEVYKLLGKPKEDFASVYVWEYYWPGQGGDRLLRVEFVEQGGKWVVQKWQWR